MKLACNRRLLYEGLQVVSRAISGRSTLPVLSNVLLDAKNDVLRLVSTDLEIGLECKLHLEVDEPGALTVPARLLGEIVGGLPEATIEVSSDGGNVLSLRCGSSHYTMRGLTADEFPVLPRIESGARFTLPRDRLRQVIRQTVLAASVDETRQILTGCLIIWDGTSLKMVATDSYRLAVKTVSLDGERQEPITRIVPSRTLHELQRLLGDGEETIEVLLAENQALFRGGSSALGAGGEVTLVSRLIEGQFPNYERVIPEASDKHITVGRADLLACLRRAVVVARSEANKVIFTAKDRTLRLRAESGEVGEAHEELPVDMEGEEIEIAFNAEYLIDALSVIDSEKVVIELTGSLNSGLFRPADDPEYQYVVMPMQII